MIPATQLKVGTVIRHSGKLARITELNHVTPGKGRGMVHAKMRDVRTGDSMEYRFRSDERAENVALDQQPMEYLYQDGDGYCFMNTENYEQVTVPGEALGDKRVYLTENMKVQIEFFEHEVIGVELPLAVELEITETSPPMKGATASGSLKPATLDNGVSVRVPEYMEIGDRVRIDTRDGSFIERV
jgi:elongation factor P